VGTHPEFSVDLAAAKQVDLMALLGNWPLRRAASTGGGELHGPCPFCGGFDRFSVQPNHPEGGRWYCRQCGENKWHDTIDFVMRRSRVSLPEAIRMLDRSQIDQVQLKVPTKASESTSDQDRSIWSEAAWNFIRDCISYLWEPEGDRAREYLHGRGLSDQTLANWLIGYNPYSGTDSWKHWGLGAGETVKLPAGIVIPCITAGDVHYIKIRRDDGEPKYQYLKGSQYWLFGADTFRDNLMGYIFESELDVLLAWQTGLKVGYASIPANGILKPEWFADYIVEDILVAPDNDSEGDKAAHNLCGLSSHIKLADHVPSGKDLTEYYQAGGDVLTWLLDQLEHINAV
jgi:DNA primase